MARYSETTYELATKAREIVADCRDRLDELTETHAELAQKSAPDTDEAAAHGAVARMLGTVPDLLRDLRALDSLAASLAQVSNPPGAKPVKEPAPAKAAPAKTEAKAEPVKVEDAKAGSAKVQPAKAAPKKPGDK